MTKEEFVALVADKGGLSKSEAGRAVDAFCESVSDALGRGEQVRLPGFGNFEVQQRGERAGRNLRTGEAITIAASKAVKFSAGRERQYSTTFRTSTPPTRNSTLIGRILPSCSRPLTYSAPAAAAMSASPVVSTTVLARIA